MEENTLAGNTNGLYITAGVRSTVVRDNVIMGNPGIQSGNNQPAARHADIVNLAPAGAVTFERNVCITAVNAQCAATTPRPR